MVRIDVDAHVDETDATWDFLTGPELEHRPISTDPGVPTVPGDRRPHRLWLIDGGTRLRRWRDDVRTGTVRAHARADRRSGAARAHGRVERRRPGALPHALPRRLHCPRGGRRGPDRRLQPLDGRRDAVLRRSPALGGARADAGHREAVDQLRWAKENGACGVMKKGVECGRSSSHPYFFPLYEEASRLDIPSASTQAPATRRPRAPTSAEGSTPSPPSPTLP